ncbi:MAG: hypothetical protein LKJ28_04300 [Bifidobacteriaceae bacterium]|jgi:hypothetical protein|nr:hypothetical protein [Bifidobacteriaceae bacterium]
MKIFETCHGENSEEAKFCRFCGTPFVYPFTPAADEPANAPTNGPTEGSPQQHESQEPSSVSPQAPLSSQENASLQSSGSLRGSGSPDGPLSTPSAQDPQGVGQGQGSSQESGPAPLYRAQQQPQQPQQSQQPQQRPKTPPFEPVPSTGKVFWEWLLNSLKRPSASLKARTWFGFAVTAVTSLLMALCLFMSLQSIATAMASRYSSSFFGYAGDYSVSLPIALLFQAWILFAIGIYLMILATFIGKRLFGDNTQSFLYLQLSISQRLVPVALASVVLTLCAVVGASDFALVMLLLITLVLWQIVPTELGRTRYSRSVDRFWVWCGAILITIAFAAAEFAFFWWSGANAVESALGTLL